MQQSVKLIWVTYMITLLSANLVAGSLEESRINEAKKFFDRFVALGYAYDPKVANLYADTAVIKSKRTYPGGMVKNITIPPEEWKRLVPIIMPLAKARGDRDKYSRAKFTIEGNKVRINAVRYSELKMYSSPYSLLVGTDQNGNWLVYEELIETKP